MPEGDTVLRTARRLDLALSGRELTRAELRWPDLGGIDLAGLPVLETVAYGKQILTRLGGEQPLTLRSHLRMDGKWTIVPPDPRNWPPPIGVSVRAVLGNAEWTAVGVWLGMLDLVQTKDEKLLIGHLGPDIMAPDLGAQGLAEGATRIASWPDQTIGAALLDQTGVAGIGTLYMAESLFLQHVSPWNPVKEVNLPPLLATARRLLINGAKSANPNTTGMLRPGYDRWVHGRSGKPCLKCGTIVRVAPVGAAPKERPAFYCPSCQPGVAPADSERPARPLGANPNYREERRPAGYRRR